MSHSKPATKSKMAEKMINNDKNETKISEILEIDEEEEGELVKGEPIVKGKQHTKERKEWKERNEKQKQKIDFKIDDSEITENENKIKNKENDAGKTKEFCNGLEAIQGGETTGLEDEGKKGIAEALTQETTTANKMDEKETKKECGICSVIVKKKRDYELLVECEICEKSICGECHQMDKRSIGGINRIKGIHWACSMCDFTINSLIVRYKEGAIGNEDTKEWERIDLEKIDQTHTRELQARIKELEEQLEKVKKEARQKKAPEEQKEKNSVEECKKEIRKKDQEIKKLKTTLNERNDELTSLKTELLSQKETNQNLNQHINEIKSINKILETSGHKKEFKQGHQGYLSKGHQGRNFTNKPNTKNIPCRYHKRNECKYGDRCHYSHKNNEQTEPCRFYSKNQWCKYGENCKYTHELVNRYSPIQKTSNSDEKQKTNQISKTQFENVENKLLFLEEKIKGLLREKTKISQTTQSICHDNIPQIQQQQPLQSIKQPINSFFQGKEQIMPKECNRITNNVQNQYQEWNPQKQQMLYPMPMYQQNYQ